MRVIGCLQGHGALESTPAQERKQGRKNSAAKFRNYISALPRDSTAIIQGQNYLEPSSTNNVSRGNEHLMPQVTAFPTYSESVIVVSPLLDLDTRCYSGLIATGNSSKNKETRPRIHSSLRQCKLFVINHM
jgi:hypothetical protein